ncbi:hypothetical protein JCM33374_g6042 [Metschnikowia sp. JCM 33374]|nr:hypothetical protein JCM33374_g6042 [Metschnikowia sp. JCM 33374]
MDYSHELLALFNPAQFQQPNNPEWLQSGSNLPIVVDLESGESYDGNGYHYTNKCQGGYPSNDNLVNCININRHPINFHTQNPNEESNANLNTPLPYSQQQAQLLISVDDPCHATSQYGMESERKPSLQHQHYPESEIQITAQITQRSSPLEVYQTRNPKPQQLAKPQTTSSSSSTRRSSSITNGSNVDHYSNYTTSSPSKHWLNLEKSPKKKLCYPNLYLDQYEGPKYRNPGPKKYELVRGIASSSVTRPPYSGQSSNMEYIPVALDVLGASVEEINRKPWTYEERQDGRRIIRMERRQNGHVVTATFSVVGSALEHPIPEEAPPGVGVVEVSCLNYISNEDDDFGIRYSITSVEVVNIIEALIASTTMSSGLLRKEKGRIRSNLMPFWSKKPLSSKKTTARDKNDSRTDFARRIMRYEIRKPRGFDKDVRILSWEKLVPALHRALQCYYAEVPKEDLVDSS